MTSLTKLSHHLGLTGSASEVSRALRHREVGAAFLFGHGLEIGAMHYPLKIPKASRVEYLDAERAETLQNRFPELHGETILTPHYVGDIGKQSVIEITHRQFDFIVLSHVLEHVANPIQAVKNVWEGLRENGCLVIAVPDKRFTFDRTRPLTTFNHLLADYFRGVTEADDDHYVELLEHVQPEVFLTKETLLQSLVRARQRREHVHVWDSTTFKSFLDKTLSFLGHEAGFLYESPGSVNHFEYFATLQKLPPSLNRRQAGVKALNMVYRSRADLQHAFPVTDPAFPCPLLEWAIAAGATIDSDAVVLASYQALYRELVEHFKENTDAVQEEVCQLFVSPS